MVTLFILVTMHEWGHFWVARRLGVKILRFSFGFGQPLWRRVGRDGVEYVFSLLPLGGYVKLLDSREGLVAEVDKPYAFDNQPVWVRMAILLAGPITNALLGWLVFIAVFSMGIPQVVPTIGEVLPSSIAAQAKLPVGAQIYRLDDQPVTSWQQATMLLIGRLGDTGTLQLTAVAPPSQLAQQFDLPLANWSMDSLQPDPLKSLGIIPYHPPMPAIVAALPAGSPAKIAGLRVGDQIVAVNGRLVKDWPDLVYYVQTLPGQTVTVAFVRGSERLSAHLKLAKQLNGLHWVGKMGIRVAPPLWPATQRQVLQLSPLAAVKQAGSEVLAIAKFHGVVLKKMLQGKISLLSMGGPIAIFETSTIALQQGVAVYLSFFGLISVMLACINLLPIPGLDGGQLVFCLLEGIMRRPITLRWQMLLLRLGVVVLVLLMVQATVNDLIRLMI